MNNKTQYRFTAEDMDRLFLEEMNWALARWPKRSTLEKLKGFNSAMKFAACLGIIEKSVSDSFNETIDRMEYEIEVIDELYSYLSIPISCLMEYKTHHGYIPSQVLLEIADYHVWDAWNDAVITNDESVKLSKCIDAIVKFDERSKQDSERGIDDYDPEELDKLIEQFRATVESIKESREKEEVYRVDPSFLVNPRDRR